MSANSQLSVCTGLNWTVTCIKTRSDISNSSLSQLYVPVCFKPATITPVAKKSAVSSLNDLFKSDEVLWETHKWEQPYPAWSLTSLLSEPTDPQRKPSPPLFHTLKTTPPTSGCFLWISAQLSILSLWRWLEKNDILGSRHFGLAATPNTLMLDATPTHCLFIKDQIGGLTQLQTDTAI